MDGDGVELLAWKAEAASVACGRTASSITASAATRRSSAMRPSPHARDVEGWFCLVMS